MSNAEILGKVNKLEQDIQELKVGLLLRSPKAARKISFYNESEIVRESKKIRKQMWKERYAKSL